LIAFNLRGSFITNKAGNVGGLGADVKRVTCMAHTGTRGIPAGAFGTLAAFCLMLSHEHGRRAGGTRRTLSGRGGNCAMRLTP